MIILSQSETFLGVLLTLNVLCIYAERNNNFILRLLTEQSQKFKESLSQIKDRLDQRIKDFKQSKEYTKIDNIASGKTKASSETVTEANSIKFQYSENLNNLQTDLSSCYATMDSIEKANEQFRAPLFTLLFGLFVFAINQACCGIEDKTVSILRSAIWVFSILSCVYWLSIWIGFIGRSITSSGKNRPETIWNRIDNNVGPKTGGAIKMGICATIFGLVLTTSDISAIEQWLCNLIVIALAIIPICLIGIWREVMCAIKGRYSVMHMIGHLVAFVIYSIVIAVLYTWEGNGIADGIFNNITFLTNIIIYFVLLNGLICPFLFPYLKYRKPYNKAIMDLNEQSRNFDIAIENFRSGYNKLKDIIFDQLGEIKEQ